MAMNVGTRRRRGEPEVMVDINTTPLIDVMLVLLIMLIITIPIQTHAVKLNMPVGNPPPPPKPPVVVHDRRRLRRHRSSGTARRCRPRRRSTRKFRGAAAQPVQPEVHLRPEQAGRRTSTSPHVMAAAQRLGVTKIGLVGNEQFVE